MQEAGMKATPTLPGRDDDVMRRKPGLTRENVGRSSLRRDVLGGLVASLDVGELMTGDVFPRLRRRGVVMAAAIHLDAGAEETDSHEHDETACDHAVPLATLE